MNKFIREAPVTRSLVSVKKCSTVHNAKLKTCVGKYFTLVSEEAKSLTNIFRMKWTGGISLLPAIKS